ncbi:MAG: PEP-CTERM system TPR-repeat protein PrsT [Gammaproteobacteria bacterium]
MRRTAFSSVIGLAAALLFGVTATALVGCGSHAKLTDQQYVQKAEKYQREGKLTAAVIVLKNALQANPKNVEARWELGKIYVLQGHGPGAEKELTRSRQLGLSPDAVTVPLGKALLLQDKSKQVLKEIKPTPSLSKRDQALVHAIRAAAYLQQRQLKPASQELSKGLALAPKLPMALTQKAKLLAMQGDVENATKQIKALLAERPGYAPAWSLLGDLMDHQRDEKAAEADYTKAIALSANNVSDLIKRALTRVALRKYKAAEADIARVRKRAPHHPGPDYAEGLIHFQKHDYSDALTSFQKSLTLDSKYLPTIFYMGASNFMLGNDVQAAQYFQKYLSAAPGSGPARRALAEIDLRNRRYKAARELLVPWLRQNPDDVAAMNLMANVAMGQGKTDEALNYLRRLVELQPKSVAAKTRLGMGLLSTGDEKAGVAALREASKLNPQAVQPQMQLAMHYVADHDYQSALKVAKDLVAKQPSNTAALNLLGLVDIASGRYKDAGQTLHKVLEKSPHDLSATLNLAELDGRDGKPDRARQRLEGLLKYHPDNLGALMRLAMLSAKANDSVQTQKWLQQAVQAHPKTLKPRLALGRLYLRTGHPNQALTVIQKAMAAYPDTPSVIELAGRAQLAVKAPSEAVNLFQNLVQLRPHDAQAHYLLATAYAANGDGVDKARRELERALRIAPGNVPFRETIIRLLVKTGRQKQASDMLAALQKAHPGQPDVLKLRGWVAMQQNRPADAVKAYAAALVKAPSSEVAISYSGALWKAGRRREGIAVLKKWLDAHPDDNTVRSNLAGAYVLNGDSRAAESQYRVLVKRRPDDPVAWNNLASLILAAHPHEALQYAAKAAELAPDSGAVLDTLGTAQLAAGKVQVAIRTLRQASQKAPKAGEIRYHYAQALAKGGHRNQARHVLNRLLADNNSFKSRDLAVALLQSLGG